VEHVSGALQFKQHGPKFFRDKGPHLKPAGSHFKRSREKMDSLPVDFKGCLRIRQLCEGHFLFLAL
jgi:hypothetical protein